MKEKRFKGLRKDGAIVESDDINDFCLQEFLWFQESAVMTKEEVAKIYTL